MDIILVYEPHHHYKIPMGTLSAGALNVWGEFCTYAVYLGNGMR